MADLLLRRLLFRFHLEHLTITVLLGLLCAILAGSGALSSLDRRLYDSLSGTLSAEPHPDILIVAIDEFSLRQIGPWPWDRAVHAALVNQLHNYGARAVLADFLISGPDAARPDSDRLLAEALARHGRVYLPVHVEQLRGGQTVEGLPWREFAEVAHRLGHVDLAMDSDGVVRSLWLRSGVGQAFWPHIGLALLEDEAPLMAYQYQRRERGDSGARLNIREYPRRIPFSQGEYPRVSAVDLIDGRVPAELLEGRIALIGVTAEGLGDSFKTPRYGDLLVPGVEIHARVLDGLLGDQLISDASPLVSVLISVLIASLAPLLLPFCRPGWGLPLIGALLVAALVLCMVLLRSEIWWSPAATIATVLAAGPLWTWRRLEYSFDYLQRMVRQMMRPGEHSGRLMQPADTAPLLRMLGALPVRAWRLENRATAGSLLTGGEPVEDTSWQGQSASHYLFNRGNDRLELSVLWRSPQLAQQMETTVHAMLARVSAPAPTRAAALRSVAGLVDSISGAERRQRGLTRALHAALTKLDQGVLLADACGEVLLANTRLLDVLGLQGRSLSGWHLLDLARDLRLDDSHWSDLLASAMAQGRVEVELPGRHGESLLLALSRVDAGGQIGQVIALQISDITALVRVRRTRAELLHFLSHDLRSPMISILALTEKMRQSPGGTRLPDFLDQLDVHARRNLGVAEQFLQLIRLESMLQIDMIDLDMLSVVESAVEQLHEQAEVAEVAIRVDYRDEDQVWVRGNHELLTRLLVNLLSNAVRHSVPGSSVDVRLYLDNGEVCCEVRDRGAGIAPNRQSQLFSQLQEDGKGLGLRFVGLVASRHGGRMLLASQPGEGSRFTLALPALVLDEL
ncbi:MAG: CHASE2 and HATPase_c domain-containing protein [Alcanivoracaceae bacterium]|nr:CHASE2 and HATPase_c domain-containing protein [Alcanivoracaceae bacterium]